MEVEFNSPIEIVPQPTKVNLDTVTVNLKTGEATVVLGGPPGKVVKWTLAQKDFDALKTSISQALTMNIGSVKTVT